MKKWFIIFLLPSFIIFIEYIYLKNVFEIKNVNEIVKRQLIQNSVYGAAFNSNVFKYKLSLIKSTQPDIIALGSSTVMTIEDKIFKKKFINAGGAMNNIDEGILFFNEMSKFSTKPKFVILNLDFWWFNNVYNQYDKKLFFYHKNEGNTLNLKTLYEFNKSLLLNKIPLYTFKYLFNNDVLKNNYSHEDSLGLNAIKNGAGYRADGSYSYGNLLAGNNVQDKEFNNTLERIKNKNARFQIGLKPDLEELAKLKILIEIIEKLKIKYVILVPPVANNVFDVINKNQDYTYIFEFLRLLKKQYKKNVEIFFNPNLAILNNCEFIDGFHSGLIASTKVLINFENNNLEEFLIDKKKLSEMIKKNNGRVTIKNSHNYKFEEIDFLNIGCIKN